MSTTRTDIVMLLDRSGSMASIADDMVGGFNAFIAEQRASTPDATVSLYQFDSDFTEVYVDRPLTEVDSLVLVPRGRTALLDAIARSVAETRARIEARPASERPGTVVFGIITDGLENASREVSREAVKKLIERQEQVEEWTFMYLGANQDAIEVGAGLGIARDRAMTYVPGRVQEAMSGLSASVNALRAARHAGLDIGTARQAASYSDVLRDSAVAGSRDEGDGGPGAAPRKPVRRVPRKD